MLRMSMGWSKHFWKAMKKLPSAKLSPINKKAFLIQDLGQYEFLPLVPTKSDWLNGDVCFFHSFKPSSLSHKDTCLNVLVTLFINKINRY